MDKGPLNTARILAKIKNKTIVDPYYRGKPYSVNPIHHLRLHYEGYCIYTLKNEHAQLLKYLNHMMASSDSTGCELSDYLELYRTITRLKPNYVLECGSGMTSLVIAYTLKEQHERTGHKSKFISMEENPFYHEQVKKIFPQDLKEFVEFHVSERVERPYGRHLGACYRKVPDYPYDFVFIDGPTLRKTPTSPKCFNSDLINILMQAEPNREIQGLIDQRVHTYWTLKKLIPRAKFRYNPIKKLTRIQNAQKGSIVSTLSRSTGPASGEKNIDLREK